MAYLIYKSGAWQDVEEERVYSNGAWKTAESKKIYTNGAWQDCWTNGTKLNFSMVFVNVQNYSSSSITSNITYSSTAIDKQTIQFSFTSAVGMGVYFKFLSSDILFPVGTVITCAQNANVSSDKIYYHKSGDSSTYIWTYTATATSLTLASECDWFELYAPTSSSSGSGRYPIIQIAFPDGYTHNFTGYQGIVADE